uniref:Birch protein n=1 Tax=Betula platyphylla TaxID=78630 RepID=A0A9E9L7Y6_BETPL|nr:birch protein [Betula platyphylla]
MNLSCNFEASYRVMTSATAPASATNSTKNVFDVGKYETVLRTVETGTCTTKSKLAVPPPKPLLIAMPSEAGEFPLLVFLHGYLLYNSFYSQLIQHIASHGFIVIAPQARLSIPIESQLLIYGPKSLTWLTYNLSLWTTFPYKPLYTVAGPDATDDIKSTVATTNWLSEGLLYLLPPDVQPNIRKLGLAGHSRGGKTAFAVALEKASTSLKFSALIGIDPVDGTDKGKQTPPPVLTYVPHSFDLDMAAMVIGTELGEMKKNPLFPAPAPKGVNHEDFFNECQKPACHFLVKDYGHVDMLDDDTKGIRGKATYCLCKNGKSRKPMRTFVGGIVVAFMKAYLLGDNSDLMAIRDGHETAPVELKTMEFLV